MSHATKAAHELRTGDLIDLEGDPYATTPGEDMSASDRKAHESTVLTFEFEYATVESVEPETPDCFVIHTSLTSFACPPDHTFKIGTP